MENNVTSILVTFLQTPPLLEYASMIEIDYMPSRNSRLTVDIFLCKNNYYNIIDNNYIYYYKKEVIILYLEL